MAAFSLHFKCFAPSTNANGAKASSAVDFTMLGIKGLRGDGVVFEF